MFMEMSAERGQMEEIARTKTQPTNRRKIRSNINKCKEALSLFFLLLLAYRAKGGLLKSMKIAFNLWQSILEGNIVHMVCIIFYIFILRIILYLFYMNYRLSKN